MKSHELKMLLTLLGCVSILSIAGGIYLADKNKDLRAEINLQEEVMDAAKKRDNQTINQLDKKLLAAKETNTSLNNQVNEVNQLLKRRESLIGQLRHLNNLRNKQIDTIEARLAEQEFLVNGNRKEWENKKRLLENELLALNEKLGTMVPRSSLTIDGFLVKAIKRNDKVTAKAKKVDELEISFNIPSELELEGSETIYLSLLDINGNSMTKPLITMRVGGTSTNSPIPIHASKTVDFGSNTERILFTINSDNNIKPGNYRASVYTKQNYLGTVEFSFRDSFWFF